MQDEVVVELFAGPGGTSTGLRLAGYTGRSIGLEWDTAACETGRANGHERVQVDIAEVEPVAVFADSTISQVVGLIASPPCQGFSAAGAGRGREDSLLMLDALAMVESADDLEQVLDTLHSLMKDDRSLLALEPLLWTLRLRPDWIAWEQVPLVQQIWDACAEVLRKIGYSVDTGVLHAEQYGVPQTRRRAILVGSRTQEAKLPTPTHSKYHTRNPSKFDPGVLPWVSMATALGIADDALIGFPRKADGRDEGVEIDGQTFRKRDLREADRPSLAVTENIRSSRVFPTMRASVSDTGSKKSRNRPLDEPAQTITGRHRSAEWHDAASREWRFAGAGRTSQQSAGQIPREPQQPAHTITGKGTAAWVPPIERDGEVLPRHDRELVENGTWPTNGPSTTICGDSRVFAPGGHHTPGAQSKNSIRVSIQEAAILQSFPADYIWTGSKTAQFRQVGDSVPPVLAAAYLAQFVEGS